MNRAGRHSGGHWPLLAFSIACIIAGLHASSQGGQMAVAVVFYFIGISGLIAAFAWIGIVAYRRRNGSSRENDSYSAH